MMTSLEELTAPGLVWNGRGKDWPLQPVDGYGMQMIKTVPEEDELAVLRAAYKVVARCLGVPFDTVFGTEDLPGFSEQEVREIMDILQRPTRKVEASVSPNSAPAGENAAAAAV